VSAIAERRPTERLTVPEVLDIADQLLDVLASAHAKGIVHRDLKPENLFLTKDRKLKVLDFGIAKVHQGTAGGGVTQTGTLMGTPAFMAPEQALGEWARVDARTDLWAVGATMFTLLTGRFVHQADTLPKLLLAHMTRPAPALQSVDPTLPAPLSKIVDQALAFDQEQRFPDARSMQAAIRVEIQETGSVGPHSARFSAPTVSSRGLEIAQSKSMLDATTLIDEPHAEHPSMPSSFRIKPGDDSSSIGAWRRIVPVAALLATGAVVAVASWGVRNDRADSRASSQPAASSLVTASPSVDDSQAPRLLGSQRSVVADEPGKSATASATASAAAASATTSSAALRSPTTKAPDRHARRPDVDAAASSAKPADALCNPPFVMEPNGAKRYKPECL
jgi:serine/threonine-protein kinase